MNTPNPTPITPQAQRLHDIFAHSEPLEAIQSYARAAKIAPLACLIMAIHETLGHVPPTVTLDAGRGPGSLNLFSCITGPSGAGKSLVQNRGLKAINLTGGDFFRPLPMGTGSGEGLIAALDPTTEGNTGSGLLIESEITNLGELMNRSGSTFRQVATKAFTGETLAINNKKERVCVEEGTYRFGMSVGVQPEHSDVILTHGGQGFPQRFVWVGTTDPLRERGKDYGTPRPYTIDIGKYQGPHIIHGCDEQVRILQEHSDRVLIDGDTGGLNGHAFFTRSKIAAAISILRGHSNTTGDDWRRAGLIMEESDHQREQCQRKANEKNAIREAELQENREVANQIAHDKKRERIANLILTKVGEGDKKRNAAYSWGNLRKTFPSRDRQEMDEVFETLAEEGLVSGGPGEPVAKGANWRETY